jgi:hypothetical protein
MKISFVTPDTAKRAAAIALVLAAAAGVVAGREKPALDIGSRAAPRAQPAAALDIDLARLERAPAAAPQRDPFAPRSFAPPPPPPPPQENAPQAAPSAPPLPFRYVGTLTANGKTEVLVVRGEELISIVTGQNIDGEYRVDAISDQRIAFTYLPLKKRQSIELDEDNG